MGAGVKLPGVTPAQATVEPDPIARAVGGGEAWWRVTVFTPPWWHPPRRAAYTIVAFSDTLAAQEGLRRFEEETAKPHKPLIV
jgi:hypothetical protein